MTEFRKPKTAAPYAHSKRTVSGMMRDVLLALVPVTLALTWLFGSGVLLNVIVAAGSCVAFEALVLRLRGQDVEPRIKDCSALVTGLLLALCLPPTVPFWIPVIGSLFAIVLAKHVYGGLGYNLFNPAMVGFAVLLVSFPAWLGYWPPPALNGLDDGGLSFTETLRIFATGEMPVDAVSRATPLDAIKSGLGNMLTMPELKAGELFDGFGPRGWVWVNLAALCGGIWLLVRKVISWRIPLGVVAGLALPALFAMTGDSAVNPSPWLQLMSGGTMLGVFFIATDPVSSAATPKGQIIYGIGIGLLTWIIRTWGAYPDGFAFAVLLMNLCVPLIDRYTAVRIYGHR